MRYGLHGMLQGTNTSSPLFTDCPPGGLTLGHHKEACSQGFPL
ncbi:hypothetical protein HMPREF9413_0431 [Paenibacillus sp. HGF7]|nr:hypothetical protein HMPREF9413_0431 [Paenibacillus sp. HGF7]